MFQGAEMLFTVYAAISERSSDFIFGSPKLEEGKRNPTFSSEVSSVAA